MATVLKAEKRTDLRTSENKSLRRNGQVPAVLYGKTTDSTAVSVHSVGFIKTIREVGRNGIIDLEVEGGKKHQVIAHDVQIDRIKDQILHIDFFAVDMKSEMEAEVSVNLVGEAPGEKDGGVVSNLLFTLTVSALPADIPEEITVDISELSIGDSISVEDVKASGNFEIINEPTETVVTVVTPDIEEEPEEDDEEQEPEVIGEESDDSEETEDENKSE